MSARWFADKASIFSEEMVKNPGKAAAVALGVAAGSLLGLLD
jgi:hypothetical protein